MSQTSTTSRSIAILFAIIGVFGLKVFVGNFATRYASVLEYVVVVACGGLIAIWACKVMADNSPDAEE
jgi:hypothetical protein